MTYQYRICGLQLASNIPFPFPQIPIQDLQIPDIEFTLKSPGVPTEQLFPLRMPLGNIKNGAGYPSITVYQIDQGFLLDCHNTRRRVEFVLALNGSTIDCYPQLETGQEDIETWLFGLVLAFLLQGRGIFSLHAAAISCHGRAVAFLGNNGFGKSTLALFFLRQGHSLITDDVLPITVKESQLFALPVCPAVNLWSHTLAQFTRLNRDQAAGEVTTSKRRYSVETLQVPFCQSPVPLGGIYFLNASGEEAPDTVQLRPVPRAEALVRLLGQTRANSMIQLSEQERLFGMYARLVSQVPVRDLAYPRKFESLPDVYDAVLRDVCEKSAGSRS